MRNGDLAMCLLRLSREESLAPSKDPERRDS